MNAFDVEFTGDWTRAVEAFAGLERKFQAASKQAVLQEAQYLRTKIVEGINKQAPGGQALSPLSKYTLAVRRYVGFRGTKALIRTQGDLRNGVTATPQAGGAFVGVLRTAKGSDGESLVDVARHNEEGFGPFVVPITPKSRRFFHAAMAAAGITMPRGDSEHGGGVAIAIIRTPPRPFIGPVLEKELQVAAAQARFYARLAKSLSDYIGEIWVVGDFEISLGRR